MELRNLGKSFGADGLDLYFVSEYSIKAARGGEMLIIGWILQSVFYLSGNCVVVFIEL